MTSENKESTKHPKVFISYSWTSEEHKELVRSWADELILCGIDAIIDVYDLKDGDDTHAFMERMVTDDEVTHVLIVCDREYMRKANEREKGVGTESQIISKRIYEKVTDSKFIPIVAQFSEDDKPALPVYLESRKWIDFSTLENVNKNWEQLVRHLFNKPLHQKPALGPPPPYIADETSLPSSPVTPTFRTLREAIMKGDIGLPMHRQSFLVACIEFVELIRTRERPEIDSSGERVLADCRALKQVRDHIVDWVLIESKISPTVEFTEALIGTLENLYGQRSREPELNEWNDVWRESHSVFLYETFLYIVAGLLNTKADTALRKLLTCHYLLPKEEFFGDGRFQSCVMFAGDAPSLQSILAPVNQTLISPAAELIKRHADRSDISFLGVIEADVVIFLLALLQKENWYPKLLHYKDSDDEIDIFVRATTRTGYTRLVALTDIVDPQKLRESIKPCYAYFVSTAWSNRWDNEYIWRVMNMEKLATIV